jgi:methyltransferase (TIGR00027 family)
LWHRSTLDALDLDYDAALKRIPNAHNITVQTFRTKAFDTAMLDALRKGAKQVVVLGAGFDSRGYRFQSQLRGVRFMEVDYGPTQEYKKARVKEILGAIPSNVSYVPMDFTKDSLLEQLGKAGYSERQKTFFLWEGVVVYLPESAVKDTLHFVRDHAAPDSRIAFDYIPSAYPDVNNPQSLYARWGEPWIFGFPAEGAAPYVRREGLDVISDTRTVQNICIASAPKVR